MALAAEFKVATVLPKVKTCYKHTAGEDQNQYVKIADQVSNHDLNFLALLDGENGLWTPTREHDGSYYRNADWVNGKFMPAGYYKDFGLCGTSNFYHWDKIDDPRFFTDPKWQIEQCYEMYKGGTTFYAAKNIPTNKKHFTCN